MPRHKQQVVKCSPACRGSFACSLCIKHEILKVTTGTHSWQQQDACAVWEVVAISGGPQKRDKACVRVFCTGAGAAWLWQGGPTEALTPATVQEMSGFLSAAHPRLRVLGGTRFNTVQEPQPEWADFGSYCFMLPRSAVMLLQCDKIRTHYNFCTS